MEILIQFKKYKLLKKGLYFILFSGWFVLLISGGLFTYNYLMMKYHLTRTPFLHRMHPHPSMQQTPPPPPPPMQPYPHPSMQQTPPPPPPPM